MQNRAQLIRMIMVIAQEEVAEYLDGEGAYCPVCVKLGLQPPNAHIYKCNLPIRYHVCSICTHRFKSVQKNYVPPVPSSSPSKLPDKPARKKKQRMK